MTGVLKKGCEQLRTAAEAERKRLIAPSNAAMAVFHPLRIRVGGGEPGVAQGASAGVLINVLSAHDGRGDITRASGGGGGVYWWRRW